MEAEPVAVQQHKGTDGASMPSAQVSRMRAAIDRAVAVGPRFLRGDIDADQMANTMVRAVRDYAEQEGAAGGEGVPGGAELHALQNVLGELMACGSGYLAGRCDAACVGRTMTQLVREFGSQP